MTVVYPLATQIDHTELKYSLRSIEKYLAPPFDVVIVGDHMPDWITGVTQINIPDVKGQTNFSVRRKVAAAIHYAGDVFFFNDDFYLLKPADQNFPYYSSGNLKGKGEPGAASAFKQLEQMGKPTQYFGHYPAIYKSDFSQVLQNFTTDCVTKSAYLNYTGVETTEIPDCKLIQAKKPDQIREFIKGKPCFSTGVNSLKSAIPILDELFPEPSKYEL